ncbi:MULTISPECIES: YdcF family protein [Romboutsia]|jgi:uncharacterized SAM-binding protein YcdF (DUF218 family)|nr:MULTISPECIES: YdcF family protein [Romboutsia]MCI9061757.1 YdcF family protein [Romboutsia sp.]MCI9260005.1 YdcF family protein [Romboutsia sp.]
MNKRKYIMFAMIIIGVLSILEWGISFSSIFLIVSMALIYIVFSRRDLCSKSKHLNIIYNIYKIIIIIFVSSFLLLEGLILLNINETKDVDKVDNIDTMIVLGAKVNGTEISNTLKLRLDKAIEYYNKHKSVNIIVSGGQGNDENITEALAMKNYLISNGVNSNNIIEENKATTTLENIIYSKKILDNMNNKGKVLIVTSDYHLFRGRLIASILGIENEGLCSTSSISGRLYYMIREYPTSIIDLVKSMEYMLTYKNI